MSIAGDHGSSLLAKGQNIEESESGIILSDYPSHGYVIDRRKRAHPAIVRQAVVKR